MVKDEQNSRICESLLTALDALRTGIALFDLQDRLIYCNEHFRYIYHSFDAERMIGKTFGEILREIVAAGEIAGEAVISDPEGWMEDRKARRMQSPPRPVIERLADGRWFEIKDRPVKGEGVISLWQDVTASTQADLRLADFLEGAADGLALWNQQDQLSLGNSLFLDLFEETARPTPGTAFTETVRNLVRPAMGGDDEAIEHAVGNWIDQHNRPAGSFVLQLRDGRWMVSRERRTRDGGTATVLTDITDLKNREQELILRGATMEETIYELEMVQHKLESQASEAVTLAEELSLAKTEVERANQAKVNFLRNISHELRTPLHTIIGFAELIEQRSRIKAVANLDEFARDILDSGRHLLALVNQLLDLSRIDAGRYSLTLRLDDISVILDDALRLVGGAARDAEVRVVRETIEPLPPAMIDEQAVRQILVNLLSNAIKFTPTGGTIVVRGESDGGQVSISVSDNGVGIPAEVMPRLMRPFERVESNPYAKTEGTGLGLAISHGLAQLHGGTLKIESELGKGTTATLVLPVEQAGEGEVWDSEARTAS